MGPALLAEDATLDDEDAILEEAMLDEEGAFDDELRLDDETRLDDEDTTELELTFDELELTTAALELLGLPPPSLPPPHPLINNVAKKANGNILNTVSLPKNEC